jgi:hypothetical protein
MTCEHLQAAVDVAPTSDHGCPACLAGGFTDWVHLRLCLTCGNVACCDSSPRRHATAHHTETKHPVIRSHQPGETWRWCYIDAELG